MHYKLQHTIEGLLIAISFKWQPFFGILASLAAIIYYGSMLKMNVVDIRHGGSWKKYFKSIFRL